MMAIHRNCASLTPLLLLFCGCNGLFWEHENKSKPDLGVAAREGANAQSAAYRDSIGARTYYEGLGPMRVRGYGLVVGLGKNGSRDCPKAIYEPLVQSLYKQHRFFSEELGVKSITPEQLIDDLDTAVVLVQGDIPPAAVEGARFDVSVMALPGTQTKSLIGGRLFTTELEMFRENADGATLTGATLAKASGPLFFNPFSDEESATQSNPLRATILGGGKVVQDRRIRLVLTEPSHLWARKIQERVNARFPSDKKIADATSPSFIQLRVPEEYKKDAVHFLGLVRALYLSSNPSFEAARSRELAQELIHPSAPHALVALALEGLGRPALPVVTDLYAHVKPFVSFHSAVVGLRLGDHLAVDALAMHAQDASSEFRFQAIRALGESTGIGGAVGPLRRLLGDEDPRVQIAAYDAIAQRGDVAIQSKRMAHDSFTLDHVPQSRGPVVYARRTAERKIVLFGADPQCVPPLLYRAPDGCVTLTADTGDDQLTLLRTVVATGTVSPTVTAPLGLRPLIELLGGEADVDREGQVTGLGLDYVTVVRMLHRLCSDHAVDARFILEQPNAAEMFGPSEPTGRPESEL